MTTIRAEGDKADDKWLSPVMKGALFAGVAAGAVAMLTGSSTKLSLIVAAASAVGLYGANALINKDGAKFGTTSLTDAYKALGGTATASIVGGLVGGGTAFYMNAGMGKSVMIAVAAFAGAYVSAGMN
jgi:hypothetical protein